MSAIHQKDSYKIDHRSQYNPGTSSIYANWTARSGKHSNIPGSTGVLFTGLQGVLLEYFIDDWTYSFFTRPAKKVVPKYKARVEGILGREMDVQHIYDLHSVGYLPIEIKALPEGSFVPYGVPMITFKETIPEFFWVVNMLESAFSCEIWQPITSATTYYYFRKLFNKYAEETGSPLEFCKYQGHDFSMRGMGSRQAAAKSGASVLLAGTYGTDNVPAVDYIDDYYNPEGEVIGQSVPATEHSVMCSGGKDDELDTYVHLLTNVYPTGPVSVVSDTWDFWKVVTETLPSIKSLIIGRDGKLIIRPDSGDPVDIICGTSSAIINIINKNELNDFLINADTSSRFLFRFNDKTYRLEERDSFIKDYSNDIYWQNCNFNDLYDNGLIIDIDFKESPESKGLIECLWDTFGGTINEKGYKVLDPHVGAIYGDSITYDRARRILEGLKAKGFASCNIVLGLGSYLFQNVTRDTHGFAMKTTLARINGVDVPLFKDPKTDDGTKKSAKGYIMVTKVGDTYSYTDQVGSAQERQGCLETVFKNGQLVKSTSLKEVRDRVSKLLGE